MNQNYSTQEVAILRHLEPHEDGVPFMELREHVFSTVPNGKEDLSKTLTSLSARRLTTSKLKGTVLYMELTREGRTTLKARRWL